MIINEHLSRIVNYRDNLLTTLVSDVYLNAVDQNKAPMPQKALVTISLAMFIKFLQEIQLCNQTIEQLTAISLWQLDRTKHPDVFKTVEQYLTK